MLSFGTIWSFHEAHGRFWDRSNIQTERKLTFEEIFVVFVVCCTYGEEKKVTTWRWIDQVHLVVLALNTYIAAVLGLISFLICASCLINNSLVSIWAHNLKGAGDTPLQRVLTERRKGLHSNPINEVWVKDLQIVKSSHVRKFTYPVWLQCSGSFMSVRSRWLNSEWIRDLASCTPSWTGNGTSV